MLTITFDMIEQVVMIVETTHFAILQCDSANYVQIVQKAPATSVKSRQDVKTVSMLATTIAVHVTNVKVSKLMR